MAADVEKSDQWIAAKVRYWQTLKKFHFSSRANKNGGADDVTRPFFRLGKLTNMVFIRTEAGG